MHKGRDNSYELFTGVGGLETVLQETVLLNHSTTGSQYHRTAVPVEGFVGSTLMLPLCLVTLVEL